MITHIWAVTLTVSDLEQAVRFYENMLGLTKKYQLTQIDWKRYLAAAAPR